MYGNIETYTEYVWKCERIGNVYGNIKKYKEYVWKHKEICPGIHDSECARGSLGSQPVNQQPIAKYSKPLKKTKTKTKKSKDAGQNHSKTIEKNKKNQKNQRCLELWEPCL